MRPASASTGARPGVTITGCQARLPGSAPPARAGTSPARTDRGLARAARPGDDQHGRVDQAGDQARDEAPPAVEQRRVGRLVGGQALVRAGTVRRRTAPSTDRLRLSGRSSSAGSCARIAASIVPQRRPGLRTELLGEQRHGRGGRRRARRPAGRPGRARASAAATSPPAAAPRRPAAPAPGARRRAGRAASCASRSPATAPARTSASRRRSVSAKGASGQSA